MTGLVAIVLGGLAAVVWVGRPSLLAARLGLPAARRAEVWRRLSPRMVLLGSTVAAGTGGLAVAGPVGLAAGLFAVPFGQSWLRRRRQRQARRRRDADVAEGCVALAGELASGVPPAGALSAVAVEWPDLFGPAAGRAALGGDPSAALRATGARPGAGALRAVAAAWELSERTGAALSSVLVAVADSVRAEATVRREAEAQLAAVRATARLMACLPVATLLLFSAGDGDALGFLTGTPVGLGCLVVAALFVAGGVFWVDRVSQQTRSSWES
ncbi:type II secretion system protein [Jiangella aurantiaca]|uniref:Type II secretion system protein n=1 Tax=Jiangella aurantiaca TaxID=2530373 RepID=A0A4R5AFV1_9ACTN|nr:type II secretion system F family protein [Jiangella aurantiaca]TDD70475.1 type II secretion system protein [Jiangella aurantiaca]